MRLNILALHFLKCLCLAVFLVGGSVACSKVKSNEVSPSATYIVQSVKEVSPTRAHCFVSLNVRDEFGNSIELADGEKLFCNGVQMDSKTGFFGSSVYYIADVPMGTDRIFSLQYRSNDKIKSETFVKMPASIQVISPSSSFEIESDQAYLVRWQPEIEQAAEPKASIAVHQEFEVNGRSQKIAKTETKWTDDVRGQVILSAPQSIGDGALIESSTELTVSVVRSRRTHLGGSYKGYLEAETSASVIGKLR